MTLSSETSKALAALHADLRAIFGDRLRCLLVYGAHVRRAADGQPTPARSAVNTLALVDTFTFHDLSACASRAATWSRRNLAAPLILDRDEFQQSLDVFPVEYGGIIAEHAVVAGVDPFSGLSVKPDDLRRACEVLAKSHTIHLREGYIEARGDPSSVAQLVDASAEAFAALLSNVARLEGAAVSTIDDLERHGVEVLRLPAGVVRRVVSLTDQAALTGAEALELFPLYLEASERLVRYVDAWKLRA